LYFYIHHSPLKTAMAKNTGVVQLQGNLGNLTFAKDGQVRQKPTSRTITAVRTLENNAEFKTQSKGTSLLGESFRACIANAKSSDWHNRLSVITREVIKLDLTNPRGQRGIIDDETSLYEGYNFNSNAPLGRVLYAQVTATIDRTTGNCQVIVPALTPGVSVAAPQGATHFKYISCSAEVDFEAETIKSSDMASDFVPLSNTPQTAVTLNLNQTANAAKPIFIGFGLEFYQEVNGQKYILQNGQYNPFQILKVDTGVV
jgi:hypothetical protein